MSGSKWANIFGISFICLTLSIFSGVVSQLSLTTSTHTAQEGKPFSMSCTSDADLHYVVWLINMDTAFTTQSNSSNGVIQQFNMFKDVTGPIVVSTSPRQHNVTLSINSALDSASKWRCQGGGVVSNTIKIKIIHTVHTTASKTDKASPVTEKPSSQKENPIYIIAGSAGGGVVVIVIVVVVCVLCARKKRSENIKTKNNSQGGLQPAHKSPYDNKETEFVGNALYSSGYVDHDYSTVDACTNAVGSKAEVTDDTRVTDVYAQVQKKKDKTEVQVTVNIEDLYAKPVNKKGGATNRSLQNNVNISIGQIADEDV